MAQACVMVQRNVDPNAQEACVMTPLALRANPDTSLITSTVRKRKDPVNKEVQDGKRGKVSFGGKDIFGDQATSSAVDDEVARCQKNLLRESEDAGDAKREEGTLFSPTFHLADKDSVALAGHGTSTPIVDNVSTDVSTGTSASLDQVVTSGTAGPLSPQNAAVPEQDEGEEEWDFDPFVFIKRLPPLHQCIAPRNTFLLPRQTRHSKRKTLVLDLDETLVHSSLDGECQPDFTFPVHMGPIRHIVAVRMRPHLQTFLLRVSKIFEVVVFTASQQVYAEQLLDTIDPRRTFIRHRIYRDSCVLWEGNYLKDLTVLGRDLAHVLIVDNSPQAFGFQLDNGVPIESWYDDDKDTELLKLLPFLERIAEADDVRPLIQAEFRLQDIVAAAAIPSGFGTS